MAMTVPSVAVIASYRVPGPILPSVPSIKPYYNVIKWGTIVIFILCEKIEAQKSPKFTQQGKEGMGSGKDQDAEGRSTLSNQQTLI